MALKCSGRCSVIFLVIMNFIVMVLGLGLLIPGILLQFNVEVLTDEIMPLLNELTVAGLSLGDAAKGLSIALICVGSFVLIVSLFGLLGACTRKKVLLVIYAVILIVLCAAKIAIVIIWILMKDTIEGEIKGQMVSQLVNNYKVDSLTGSKVNLAWIYLFTTMKCCAVNGVTGTSNDFDNSVWQQTSPTAQIPKACCTNATLQTYPVFSSPGCTDTVSSGYHTQGCYDSIKTAITQYVIVAIAIGVSIIIIEILAIAAAFTICAQAGKKDKIV